MISDRTMVRALNSTTTRRVAAVAPPGSLLKRHPVQPRGSVKKVAGRDAAYLDMIRQCPCLKCGMQPSEAAHVRYASAAFGKASGLGKKPSDAHAVPLCSGCHRLDRDAQHNRSEKAFWADLGINPLLVAEKLYAQRGDLVAMQSVVMVAIAERTSSPPSRSALSMDASPASTPHRAPPPRPEMKPEGGEPGQAAGSS
jgi:hypothetical protein